MNARVESVLIALSEVAFALMGAFVIMLALAFVLSAVENAGADRTFRQSCEDDGGMALESAGGLVCADSAIIIAR